MKVTRLGTSEDGTRRFEIQVGSIPYHSLLRCIRKIPGMVVVSAIGYPKADDAEIKLKYKDVTIKIATPYTDYLIECKSPSEAFDEFIAALSNYKISWWERLF